MRIIASCKVLFTQRFQTESHLFTSLRFLIFESWFFLNISKRNFLIFKIWKFELVRLQFDRKLHLFCLWLLHFWQWLLLLKQVKSINNRWLIVNRIRGKLSVIYLYRFVKSCWMMLPYSLSIILTSNELYQKIVSKLRRRSISALFELWENLLCSCTSLSSARFGRLICLSLQVLIVLVLFLRSFFSIRRNTFYPNKLTIICNTCRSSLLVIWFLCCIVWSRIGRSVCLEWCILLLLLLYLKGAL